MMVTLANVSDPQTDRVYTLSVSDALLLVLIAVCLLYLLPRKLLRYCKDVSSGTEVGGARLGPKRQ